MADTRVYPGVENGTLLTDTEVVALGAKDVQYVRDCERHRKHLLILYVILSLMTTIFAVSVILFFAFVYPKIVTTTSESITGPIFVTMIWRHGDRAPERLFDAIKVSNDSFPNGLGNLTQLGKLQAEIFGAKLKQRYFSSDEERHRKVFIRSTQVTRTKQTAQIIASVLDLPNTIVTADVTMKLDTEGNPFYDCPSAYAYLQKMISRCCMRDKYQDIYSLIEKKVNYTGDVHPIMDLLYCMRSHNLPTPKWAQNTTFLSIIKYLSWNGLATRYGLQPFPNITQNKLTGGAILNGVMDKLENAIKCDMNYQRTENTDCDIYFSGLSAHDITIVALFSTFPNYEKILSNVPYVEYLANVAFEVWRLPHGQYGIRALYANSFREEPVEITQYLPGCDSYEKFCPYANFVAATEGLYYDDVNVLHEQCQLGKGRHKREVYFNGNLVDYFSQ